MEGEKKYGMPDTTIGADSLERRERGDGAAVKSSTKSTICNENERSKKEKGKSITKNR